MVDVSELLALAERCEKAAGADREIDRDIGLAFGLYDQPEDLGCFEDEAEAVVGGGGQTYAPPAYTTSIDAAMTLVPEGWGWTISVHYVVAKEPCVAFVLHPDRMKRAGLDSRGDAATPALALCAAALRSIAQEKANG